MEKRLNATLKTVENRVVFLEKLNADWTEFNTELEELRHWTHHNAPLMVQALKIEETEPKERLNKAKVLQRSLVEKMETTKNLEKQCQELTEGISSNFYITNLIINLVNCFSLILLIFRQ